MTKKRRKPRRIVETPTFKPWKVAAIADVHMSAATLERGLRVLARVRDGALVAGLKTVVILGDFWDQRGVLSVRQLDAIFDMLETYREVGLSVVFLPGNHDQVTFDGSIHGVRVFDGFDHVRVFTDLHLVPEYGVAYIPWREDPEEQQAMFAKVPEGYTVFAHCEIKGATTNSSHTAEGRVEPGHMSHLRAVYAGHYHKRQQLGNAWYIGSPFEMNFGERDWPHGCAILSSKAEPEFIDWDDFPHHWRLTYPDDVERFPEPDEFDVVEVYAAKDDLRDPDFLAAVDTIPASDVRRLPIPEAAPTGAPVAALSLDDAIEAYADENASSFDYDPDELKRLGRELLAEVPDTAAIVPMGSEVVPTYVSAHDFCALRGSVAMELNDIGSLLIVGPNGVGKTSLFDAISWGLYGMTSPRKAGSAGSTLRADDVIHDEAEECKVVVKLEVDGQEVTVTRSKKRGKGAKVEIEGVTAPTGISDTQDLINHAVGIDYDLWRTCVSLGQGDVANFVTDADKKRKELLSRAFQLGSCPHAVKLIRKRLKPLADEAAKLRMDAHRIDSKIKAIEEMDFTEESKRWADQQIVAKQTWSSGIEMCKSQIEEYDKHLAREGEWIAAKDRLVKFVDEKSSLLVKASNPARAGKIHQEMGRVRSEKSQAEVGLHALQTRLRKIQGASSSGVSICDVCGQRLTPETKEQLIDELEVKVQSAHDQMRSFDLEMSNLAVKLGELTSTGTTEHAETQRQIDEAREKIRQCDQALNAIAAVKSNRAVAVSKWENFRAQIEAASKQENPFAKKAEEAAQSLAEARAELTEIEEALAASEATQEHLRFWETGFGPKGIPVVVLRTALHELEMYANRFLATLMGGRVYAQLEMMDDDLKVVFFEQTPTGPRERTLHMLSGGMRRCAQLAFVPFALSELIFSRTGVRIPLLLVDELTAHLDTRTKAAVCSILDDLGRGTVVVIDHDPHIEGEFDHVIEVSQDAAGYVAVERR